MSETLTHSHEAANLTHEQMAQDVIGRSQKLIARAEHGVGVRPTYGGGKRYVVGTGEKTERSAWSGEEHKSLTSYSVTLEADGSAEIRRDIETHTPERHSRGRTSGHAFESLALKSDGSVEYIDASEEGGEYSRYKKKTDADMSADQMKSFADSVFYILEEKLGIKQRNTMSQETKPQIAVDQGDVDWYLKQGLSEEDAKAEAYYGALRDMSEDQHDEDADDNPLAGDVDRWVHPYETRTDEQIAHDKRYTQ